MKPNNQRMGTFICNGKNSFAVEQNFKKIETKSRLFKVLTQQVM